MQKLTHLALLAGSLCSQPWASQQRTVIPSPYPVHPQQVIWPLQLVSWASVELNLLVSLVSSYPPSMLQEVRVWNSISCYFPGKNANTCYAAWQSLVSQNQTFVRYPTGFTHNTPAYGTVNNTPQLLNLTAQPPAEETSVVPLQNTVEPKDHEVTPPQPNTPETPSPAKEIDWDKWLPDLKDLNDEELRYVTDYWWSCNTTTP